MSAALGIPAWGVEWSSWLLLTGVHRAPWTSARQGTSPRVGPRGVRAAWGTRATLLLGKGVHAKFVQELLGHTTISITLDTYSHVLPGMGNAVAGAMDEALG